MSFWRRIRSFASGPEQLPEIEEERTGAQSTETGRVPLPVPGSLERCRRMRSNPTIALARAVAFAPVKTQGWSYQLNEPATDEILGFVRGVMDPLESEIVRNMLFGVDYGCKPFEKVWGRDDRQRLVYKKIKPLALNKTSLRILSDGTFAGLAQDAVELDSQYCFWYTHDREDDNYWGRSRHENCGKAWEAWEHLLNQEKLYVELAARPKPIVEYPPGKSRDAAGVEQSNYKIAQGIVDGLRKGPGVYMPNTLAKYAKDLIDRGVDITKLRAWLISFLETKGQHGSDFVMMMRHKESLMMRGWLCPERTATEGQYGTKADASAHADIALAVAQELLNEIVRHVNWYLIDPLLVDNFGESARGSVYVTTKPLVDEQAALLRSIMEKLLSSSAETFQLWVDVDAAMDQVGLPKLEKVIQQSEQEDVDAPAAGEPPLASIAASLAGIYGPVLRGLQG